MIELSKSDKYQICYNIMIHSFYYKNPIGMKTLSRCAFFWYRSNKKSWRQLLISCLLFYIVSNHNGHLHFKILNWAKIRERTKKDHRKRRGGDCGIRWINRALETRFPMASKTHKNPKTVLFFVRWSFWFKLES